MSTYLLAWNPKRWQWKNLADMSEKVKSGDLVTEDWSIGNSKKPKAGDRIFIIRLGEEPKGIFASGRIIRNPYLRFHWDKEKAAKGEEINFVDIQFDVLLNPSNDKILDRNRLDSNKLSSMHWDTQRSGVLIPENVAKNLEMIWEEFTDINSSRVDFTLERNRIYKRAEIHQHFGGQRQGGISTPKNRKYILLFTSEIGIHYGYEDGWDENGIFNYTGEGQEGDMGFVRGNLAIRDHQINGKEILLFSYVGSGIVRFEDSMTMTGYHEQIAKDVKNKERKVIVFELIPRRNFSNSELNRDVIQELGSLSLEKLMEKALQNSGSIQTPKERKINSYQRSEAIKQYVLKRADGICEKCGAPAPFITKSGKPYLEPHHIRSISDGGPDHPEWVVAICPNCHREAHYSKNSKDINSYLRKKVLEIERKLH